MRKTRVSTRPPPLEPQGSAPTLMRELADLQRQMDGWPAEQEERTAARVAALRLQIELVAWAREREQELIDQMRRGDADDRERRRIERQASARGWIRTSAQATGLVALVAATITTIVLTVQGDPEVQTLVRLLGR